METTKAEIEGTGEKSGKMMKITENNHAVRKKMAMARFHFNYELLHYHIQALSLAVLNSFILILPLQVPRFLRCSLGGV